MTKQGTAAVLSFLVPGVGQLYNGTFWRAIVWFLITPTLWIGSSGTLGWIFHLASAYTAFHYAQGTLRTRLPV